MMIRKTLLLVLFSLSLALYAQQEDVPARKGWWNFNDTNNLVAPVAGYGQALELVGSHSRINGPAENDYAVNIGIGSHYRMDHQIPANGGGSYVNEFTLQIDFKVESIGDWYCFFQTNPDNSNDGDCFINPYGNIGVAATGYSPEAITSGQWYRLVIAVDNGNRYTYYLDGIPYLQAVVQDVDGRFALDNILLLFADENAEDNPICVSEVAIWDVPLTDDQVASLGGFYHPSPPGVNQFFCYPFLQSKTANSVMVCWHDTLTTVTRVEYGKTPALGSEATGTSEMVTFPYRWHTVKLIQLESGTKYYYRLVSGSGNSAIHSFTTLPAETYTGHIRFLLFSDSQSDSAATGFIVRSARDKVKELYGGDLDDEIDLIMHSGDITGSGSSITGWTDEFFRPFAPLSANVPFLSVAGNHEMEHRNYYSYIKYDDFSAYPSTHDLFEKFWTYRMPRILFIGFNSNMVYAYGTEAAAWLQETLDEAEQDPSIDFVFCFMHHPPVSEIWGEGNTSYVEYTVLPILQMYPKVQQLSYGHTHAYERGVIESRSPVSEGDFRISCVGGGGGARDRWGVYTNNDYPQIHTALDHYFYILFDIDLANASYDGYMFDLGNTDIPATNTAADQWHRRLNQAAPDKPVALAATTLQNGQAVLHASPFSGSDDLMSSHFQLTTATGQYAPPLLDRITDWQDIYGVDAQFRPVDLNEGADLTKLEIPAGTLEVGKTYYYRVRYRDQNLRWSEWSDENSFKYTGQGMEEQDKTRGMLRIMPNPIKGSALVSFDLAESQHIRLEITDLNGRIVAVPAEGYYACDSYDIPVELSGISAGMYLCTLITASERYTIKMEIGI